MVSMPNMLLAGARLGMICLAVLAIAIPARAQSSSDSNPLVDLGLLPKKPKPSGLTEVKPQPLAWPRLDPGAVLCRTEADLEKLGARRHGEVVDGPIDCQIIRTATAIAILQRKGPGRAEVKVSDPKVEAMTGWTDAWLPDKGKAGATSASR